MEQLCLALRSELAPPLHQAHCLLLVEQLCLALRSELAPHLDALLPPMLDVLRTDATETRMPTLRVLHALAVMAPLLQVSCLCSYLIYRG